MRLYSRWGTGWSPVSRSTPATGSKRVNSSSSSIPPSGAKRFRGLARAAHGRRRLTLTAKEFALLEVLARCPSQIVLKTAIAEIGWEINFETNTNVVEVAIRRLRSKLELPGEDKLIHTVRGMSYMLEHRRDPDVP
ncbi:helix-turn-helix domain-containing protein [Methylopila henanensis]|uniref:Helix-turn-helix domain-containing protein n=1 Tax=Methylopila henanensis TaxID=873516 RepID=A0ABW4KCZ0_9HYPH